MAAALAHELNQPLTALSVYGSACQRLAGRDGGDPLLQKTIGAMVAESRRASDVLKRLREFFRTGSVRLEPLSLPALVLVSAADVLRYSSNIGTAKLALDMPPRAMWEMYMKLGFPGAAAGRVRPWAAWRPIEQATMSYGNGIALSLVQLARAYTAFANDGEVIPLSLMKSAGRPAGARVFSPATARTLRAMLENTVEHGTAKRGAIPGYRVGGKTGTAYKAVNGRYTLPRKYIASFIAPAPIDPGEVLD